MTARQRPTREQIQSELKRLGYIRQNLTRTRSAFGDDHEEALDAQILVLNKLMIVDQVYDNWGEESYDDPEEFQQNVLDEAVAAAQWLAGDSKETPSAGWSGLYIPEEKAQ